MNKAKLSTWLPIVIGVLVFGAIATVAAFFDLAINKALYNPGCFYGQYFAKLGELPTYLAAPFVAAVFLNCAYTGKALKHQRILKLVWILIMVVGWYVCIGKWVWKNFVCPDLDYAIVYKVLATALMSVITVIIAKGVPKGIMQKLFWFAVFLVFVAAISNIIVQVMKYIWARQRFRTMTASDPSAPADLLVYCNNYQGFTPWYIPNAFIKNAIRTDEYMNVFKLADDDAFKSFPSGHTVAAGVSFALIIIPDMFPSLKKKRWIFWTVPAVYTVLVAISRIVMGAHYLSDVLFGGTIAFVTAVVTRAIFKKRVKTLVVEQSADDDYAVFAVEE